MPTKPLVASTTRRSRPGATGHLSTVNCAGRFAVCPSTLAREPQRACEVMQRDHRLDPLLSQLTEYVAVVPDLPRIELALRGFDARPLDRQAVCVLVQLAQELEVLAVAVIVVARHC